MEKKTLYLIDATAFCYRAFYAIRNLSTSYGQPTGAVYGFLTMLKKILSSHKPDYLAVCFDVSRDTFRQKKFAEYKIQRPSMPDDLSSQMPLINELISAYRLPIVKKEGYEADDIIATLSRRAVKNGFEVVAISSDKDILQIVGGKVKVFNPQKDSGVLYDDEKVKERLGVKPEDVPDLISLMGDTADNIPGIPGIGEKTATSLMQDFGTLENIINNLESVKSDKIRQSIKDNLKMLKLNKELVVLDDNVPVDFDIEELKVKEPDYRNLFELFKRLEFKSLLRELPAQEDKEHSSALGFSLEVSDGTEDSLDELAKAKEIFIAIEEESPFKIYLSDGKKKVFCFYKINKALENILKDSSIKKTSHDLKKIKVCLGKKGVAFSGTGFDTMLAAYILDSSKASYDLVDLALDYLDLQENILSLTKPQEIELVCRLSKALYDKLKNSRLEKVYYKLELPLLDVLADMEIEGVKVDDKFLAALSKDMQEELSKLVEEIFKLSKTEFNINSPKQLSEVLFERLGLPIIKKTKTGASTDEEVLTRLAKKHKIAKELLLYRQLTKLKSTYIDALPKLIDSGSGKIHASFNQTGTETGRLSSSNPNLQNIPIRTELGRKIRRAFVASGKNNILLAADYSQIELRLLAHLSRDENLISAFKKGEDIHRFTASLVFNKTIADITDEMRETTKRINFGIIYGISSYGLSKDLSITVEEAQSFIDSYFARYPRVKDFIESQINMAKTKGYVETLFGRRRYIQNIDNKNNAVRQFAQRQAVNTPVQGSAADLIKLAMIDIHKEIFEKHLSSKMILQVHDELVFDVPREEISQMQELVKDRMENVVKLDVPIQVSIYKGQNWLDAE